MLGIPAQNVMSMAHGLVLAQGVAEPEPAHVLLALLYAPSSYPTVWQRLDVDPERVRAGLAAAGVPVRPLPTPPAPAPVVIQGSTTFPMSDRGAVLRSLLRAHPPGSGVWWAWNVVEPDRCVVHTTDPSAVHAVVATAVADPATVSRS
jgi:hypothetical protein